MGGEVSKGNSNKSFLVTSLLPVRRSRKSINVVTNTHNNNYYTHYSLEHIPYSRKIWRGIKFGGLAVLHVYYNRQIKIRQIFLLAYIRMAIPYRTAKFKSANTLIIAILGSTTNFNSRQYFWLYGTLHARILQLFGNFSQHVTSIYCNNIISMIFTSAYLYSSLCALAEAQCHGLHALSMSSTICEACGTSPHTEAMQVFTKFV